jgi:hypothetical protein
MRYVYINTEFFSEAALPLPIGTILKYEEHKNNYSNFHIWRIGPSSCGSHWSYPMDDDPEYELYAYIKEYITFIDMDKPLSKLLFL